VSGGRRDHFAKFNNAVVGECRDNFIRSGADSQDATVGEVVFVADDGLEHFWILAEHTGDVFQRVNLPDRCHQAAFATDAAAAVVLGVVSDAASGLASGVQFQGNNSSRRLIL